MDARLSSSKMDVGIDKESLHAEAQDDDLYWVRARSDSAGIVVATAWMLCKPKNFRKHSHLYASCNWDSLVCHPQIFGLWFPAKARILGLRLLDKLFQEIQQRPRPIVFATFSGGFKSCLYQVFEILDESERETSSALKKYQVIRSWYAGQIHDSSPVDFVSRNGAQFASHPIILGTKSRNGLLTWSAKFAARTLDFFFLSKFEKQRADMWAVLDKSGKWGPVLILCSRDDDLSPITDIETFSSRLSSLGCKVTMMEWAQSTHVAHLRRHPDEYSRAVATFLEDATSTFNVQLARNCTCAATVTAVNGSISRAVQSNHMIWGRKFQFQPVSEMLKRQLYPEAMSENRPNLGVMSKL